VLTSMPFPSGTGWTILGFLALAFIVIVFFLAETKGQGGKVILGILKTVFLYLIDAPFVYVKVAVGFAILKWLGWI
jgi:hypothetical protein